MKTICLVALVLLGLCQVTEARAECHGKLKDPVTVSVKSYSQLGYCCPGGQPDSGNKRRGDCNPETEWWCGYKVEYFPDSSSGCIEADEETGKNCKFNPVLKKTYKVLDRCSTTGCIWKDNPNPGNTQMLDRYTLEDC